MTRLLQVRRRVVDAVYAATGGMARKQYVQLADRGAQPGTRVYWLRLDRELREVNVRPLVQP